MSDKLAKDAKDRPALERRLATANATPTAIQIKTRVSITEMFFALPIYAEGRKVSECRSNKDSSQRKIASHFEC